MLNPAATFCRFLSRPSRPLTSPIVNRVPCCHLCVVAAKLFAHLTKNTPCLLRSCRASRRHYCLPPSPSPPSARTILLITANLFFFHYPVVDCATLLGRIGRRLNGRARRDYIIGARGGGLCARRFSKMALGQVLWSRGFVNNTSPRHSR